MSDRSKLYLVDVNNWIFRAFHAIRNLSRRDGFPTNAVFGFTQMLVKLLDDTNPTHIVAVLDGEGPGFRKALYDEYKANRPPLPEALAPQIPYVHRVIDGLGLVRASARSFEADDVIATLARVAEADGWDVVVVTSDKDLAQLVGERVSMWDTMAEKRYGPAEVVEKWGVPPEGIADLLALMGDATDNIPGVRGIGQKGAAALVQEFGTLDGVYANLAAIKGKKRESLEASRDAAYLSRTLTRLRGDAPVPLDLATYRRGPVDDDALHALFSELEIRRFRERFQPTDEGARAMAEARAGALPLAAAGGATANEAVAGAPAAGATTAGAADEEGLAGAAAVARVAVGRVGASHTVVQDEDGLRALVQALDAAGAFAFDLETTSLQTVDAEIVGLSFATSPAHGWYVPIAHRGLLHCTPQLPLAQVLDALRPLLTRDGVARWAQNHKYDVSILSRYDVAVGPVDFDPMLGSYLLDPGSYRHNLDDLALEWLGHKTIKYEDVCGKGKDQIPFAEVAVERAAAYAAEDAQVTVALVHVLRPRVEEAGLGALLRDVELPLAPVIGRMEMHGLLVDTARLEVLSRRFAERMIVLEREAHAAAGGPFNLGSPKQLAEVLFDRLNLTSRRRTKTGRSTNSDVLEALADEHPLPKLVLDWRQMQKLRSTYTEALRHLVHPRTGRIHSSFHQAVAATGRLSSSDPNLQNIPVRSEEGREIRGAFVAAPGHVLLSADYSQIELRVLAHLSGDEALSRAFRDGADVHTRTAAEIHGIPEAEVTRAQRSAAKAINFGIVYGMGANRLARDIGVTRSEAQDVIARYFERYAGVKRYLDETVARARREGEVRTILDRRRPLPEINSGAPQQRAFAERTAVNTPVQGSAADVIKLAMLRVARALPEAGLRTRMALQVHDELLFEVPEDELGRVEAVVRDAMENACPLRVPLRIDIHSGADWSEAHG